MEIRFSHSGRANDDELVRKVSLKPGPVQSMKKVRSFVQ